MNDKLLRAFIEAQGYEVEEVIIEESLYRDTVIDYKVTKRKVDGRSELHRVVREYESGNCSFSEMINEIEKIEGIPQ